MPYYNDGTRFDSGARYDDPTPQPNNPKMAQITTNIGGLSVPQKITKGAVLVLKSTNNPLVPGNGPSLTAFSTSQNALFAAQTAMTAARETLRQATVARDEAETAWDTRCTLLADFTQTATAGNENAILSSGFGVRSANTPSQPLTAPENLKVATNGSPGVSKLRWSPVPGAVSYLVQCCADPITPAGWQQVETGTKTNIEIPGAVPGEPCWFRTAAVGPAGNGPWSEPARRPVM